MTANKYLSNIRYLEQQIALQEELVLSYKANFPGVTGTDYKAPRVPSYPSDKIGGYVARVTDGMNKAIKLRNEYIELKNEAIQRINRLDNGDYVDILMRRYVLYQSWRTIADETNLSERWIFKLRKRALLSFEEVNYDLFCNDKGETRNL